MTDLSTRYRDWMAAHDRADAPATLAATVLLLRDGADGLEVLMVQRNGRGEFAHNWVFPGGKVDPEDFEGGDDVLRASQVAASREAVEEVDVVVSVDAMIPFSHWMPPIELPRRFATWFYAASAPAGTDGDVTIDGGEIVDHLWVTPAEALGKQRSGDVALAPPTFVTLTELATHATAPEALTAIEAAETRFYLTKRLSGDPMTIAWHGDDAYESGDLASPGRRHRLTMHADGWILEGPTA